MSGPRDDPGPGTYPTPIGEVYDRFSRSKASVITGSIGIIAVLIFYALVWGAAAAAFFGLIVLLHRWSGWLFLLLFLIPACGFVIFVFRGLVRFLRRSYATVSGAGERLKSATEQSLTRQSKSAPDEQTAGRKFSGVERFGSLCLMISACCLTLATLMMSPGANIDISIPPGIIYLVAAAFGILGLFMLQPSSAGWSYTHARSQFAMQAQEPSSPALSKGAQSLNRRRNGATWGIAAIVSFLMNFTMIGLLSNAAIRLPEIWAYREASAVRLKKESASAERERIREQAAKEATAQSEKHKRRR
jgi:hypothetical protein